LLYPVSFAVPKHEYVLKNFINLKLLQLDEKYPEGILELILEELQKQPQFASFSLDQLKKYFVKEKATLW